jgi:flavin reductase (DIM6/NTAB) family NADH-FMN oxidoreductase RutF
MSHPQNHSPADAYRAGMRRLAAGVCLITSHRGDTFGGMIATAVTSVSGDPPTLLICVNRNASLFAMIQETGAFCVNVLAATAVPIVEQFSSSARRGERFQNGEWTTLASGSPMSAHALVAFDCEVAKIVDWQTHAIFLGEVREVVCPDSVVAPLLYMDQRFHQLGALPAT